MSAKYPVNPNGKLRRVQHVELKFHPKKMQEQIIKTIDNSYTKLLFVNMSRQYGKSFVARYMCLKWMSKPQMVVAYITPTYKLGKEVYKKFMMFLPKELVATANGTDLTIELINKSRIIFFSIESIESMRGFTLDYLLCDECAFYKEHTPNGMHWYWSIISPMLDVRGKKQLFISTPNSTSGFFYEGCMKAKKDNKKWRYIEANVYSDETRNKEWIDEQKKLYPPLRWRQEYECEFIDDGASVFSNFTELFNLETFNWNSKLYVGVDWSSVGEDSTILTFLNVEGDVIQYEIEGDLDSKYSKIARLMNEHVNNIVYCIFEKNSIGNVMGEQVKKLLEPTIRRKVEFFNTSNNSKSEIIDMLSMMIEKKEIRFMKNNVDLLEQMKTFSYEKLPSGAIRYAAMGQLHDDRVLSLAFAVYAKGKKPKVEREYIKVLRR